MSQPVSLTWTSPNHSEADVGAAPSAAEGDKLIDAVIEHMGDDFFGKLFISDRYSKDLPTEVSEIERWIDDETDVWR